MPPYRYRALVPHGVADTGEIKRAAQMIYDAKKPVIISGRGVVDTNAFDVVKALADYLTAPVAMSYLHNDAFPSDHPCCLWRV